MHGGANDPMLPDLSHLTAEERKIIEEVMARQKNEEERDMKVIRTHPAEVHPTPAPQPPQTTPPSTSSTSSSISNPPHTTPLMHQASRAHEKEPTRQAPPSAPISSSGHPVPTEARSVPATQVVRPSSPLTSSTGIATSIIGNVLGGILHKSSSISSSPPPHSRPTHNQQVAESDNPDSTCQLCHKTKFADGTGKECHFCHRHTCSRCGRRFSISASQVIWSCTLCQKKQELLTTKSSTNVPQPTTTSSTAHYPPTKDGRNRMPQPGSGVRQLPSVSGPNAPGPIARELPRPPVKHTIETAVIADSVLPPTSRGRRLPSIAASTRSAGVSPQRYASHSQTQQTRDNYSVNRQSITNNPPGIRSTVYRTRSIEWMVEQQTSKHLDEDITEFEGPGRDSQTPHGSEIESPPSFYNPPSYHHSSRNLMENNPNYPPHVAHTLHATSNPVPLQDNRDMNVTFRGRGVPGGLHPRNTAFYTGSQVHPMYEPNDAYDWEVDDVGPGGVVDRQCYSGSEDDVHTSIDGGSYAEREFDCESLSERGSLRTQNTDMEQSGYLSHRRSKFLRGRSLEEEDSGVSGLMALESISAPSQDVMPSKMDEIKSPVTWRPSRDGRKLVGHLILNKMYIDSKHVESGSALGLKVVGGQMTSSGRLGAFITHVKTGSIADVVGQLKAGDEILEWNGVQLRGQSFEDVFDIIMDSKDDSSVELIVQRSLDSAYGPRSTRNQSVHRPNAIENASKTRFSSGLPPPSIGAIIPPTPLNPVEVRVGGITIMNDPPSVELKLLFDSRNSMLVVMLLSGRNLIPQFPGAESVCCACVQFTLLPPNREDLVRISRSVSNTNFPRWNQSFIFPIYNEKDLQNRSLLVQVFDCDSRFEEWLLIGKVLIQLMHNDLSNTPCWYELEFDNKTLTESAIEPAIQEAWKEGKRARHGRESKPESANRSRRASRERHSPENIQYSGGGYRLGHPHDYEPMYSRHTPSPPRSEHFQRSTNDPRYGYNAQQGYRSQASPRMYAASYQEGEEGEYPYSEPGMPSTGYENQLVNEFQEDYSGDYRRERSRKYPGPSGSSGDMERLGDVAPNRARGGRNDNIRWEDPSGHGRYDSPQERDYASDVDQRRASAALSGMSSDEQVSIRSADSSGRHHRHGTVPQSSHPQRGMPHDAQAHSQQTRSRHQHAHQEQYQEAVEETNDSYLPSHHHHHHSHHRPSEGGYSDVQEAYEEEEEEEDSSRQAEEQALAAEARAEYEERELAEISEVSETSGGSAQFEMQRRKLGEFRDGMDQQYHTSGVMYQKSGDSEEGAGGGCQAPNCDENCYREGDDTMTGESNDKTRGKSETGPTRHERHRHHSSGPNEAQTSTGGTSGRSMGIGRKVSTVFGRNKKNSSGSNLDKKPKISFQRCEEVLPSELAHLAGDSFKPTQSYDSGSMERQGQDGARGDEHDSPTTLSEGMGLRPSEKQEHVGIFVEGLGPGQIVDRQILGMTSMGEMQLSFIDRKGHLEVEIIRARNLLPKSNSKNLPQTFVKLSLLEKQEVVEKHRTTLSLRKTLDPLYQQLFTFQTPYPGKILQVSVWGDYGRIDRKAFMGICEILLDDLNLKNIVFGWYKLYSTACSTIHHSYHHRRRSSCSTPQAKLPMT